MGHGPPQGIPMTRGRPGGAGPGSPAPHAPPVLGALRKAYHDGSWGKYHGLYVEGLEERLARYQGVEFALTCASGTFAVELALRALKVGPGDEVILAAYDYGGELLHLHPPPPPPAPVGPA